jgi:flagellar biosynthesis/type III secretory pathway protein FliH
MATEPLIVSAIRRKDGDGVLRWDPSVGGLTGTPGKGFLRELDQYIEAVKQEAKYEGFDEGYRSGYDNGFMSGYDNGYQDGGETGD